ncbi:NACHT domain protein [Apiospora phragmitis]|uniref:NACHT domain protein n=1 Tax=Apiospora phragmitis TaxID=2905665 RepID=A0ABR1VIP8_9PEZI
MAQTPEVAVEALTHHSRVSKRGTIQATLTLARVCQESKTTEMEAMQLYEELIKTGTHEIDLQDIKSTLDIMHEEQATSVISSSYNSATMSSTQVEQVVEVLRQRFSSVHEKHGWAHEESLTQLAELVSFQSLHQRGKETKETVSRELKEATVSILTTHKSQTQLVTAAKTIASSYMVSQQATQATELTEELYRQLVMKDTSNAKASQFDLSSCGRESLVFLAQLEYSLGRSSTTLTEIMASLVAQHTYFAEFRALIRSKTSAFLDVSVAAAQIHQCLESSGRPVAAARVFDQYVSWVAEAKPSFMGQAKMSPAETKILFQAILGRLSTHKSHDMVRTAGIIGNTRLAELLDEGRYDAACDLARACFKVIAANPASYHTPVIAKLVLTMGMQLGSRATDVPGHGRDKPQLAPENARKPLLETSKPILEDVLRVLQGDALKINLAKLGPAPLDQLINLLGAQENYPTLARLLMALWESREAQHDWDPAVTFALARRHLLARYAAGDAAATLRGAEHIVYNCRRVHGLCHPATLAMAGLLAQLYSGVALRLQQQESTGGNNNGRRGSAGANEIANRYYRKSAAIHEDILRGLTDPDYASVDGILGYSMLNGHSMVDGSSRSSSSTCISSSSSNGGSGSSPLMGLGRAFVFPTHGEQPRSDGQIARQHLWLLRLALERAGGWPADKGYAEYERLNAEVFARFPSEMAGAAGVERWNLAAFGQGRASADDDLLGRGELSWWGLLPDGNDEQAGQGGGNAGGGGRGR